MTEGIGLGVAIHTPLAGVGEPDVSFFGSATILDQPFTIHGGKTSGTWQIAARLDGSLDLRYTLESLFGSPNGSFQLPHDFPALTLSELSFTIDAASSTYDAHGRTVATNLPFAGAFLENASLTLDLGSTNGALHATLESLCTWQGLETQLDVQIARDTSAIRLKAHDYEFFLGRATSEKTTNVLVLVRPGTHRAFRDVELAWAKNAWSTVPFRSNATYSKGVTIQALLTLAGTKFGKLLQIDEPIRLRLDSGQLSVDIGNDGASRNVAISLGQTTTTSAEEDSGATTSTEDDEDATATNAQLTITGPLSLSTLFDSLSSTTDDSSTSRTWRDYLGQCLKLENLGFSLITSPKIGVSIILDATIQIGSWVGIAVTKASLQLIPDKLPFTDVAVDASVQSVAIVANIPPIAQASVALRYDRQDGTNIEALTGSGHLQLFDKLNVGLLAHVEWQKHVFQGAFAFVFAKGFAVGPPAFQLTGIGGGFGYHRSLVMPTDALSVATNPIVELLQSAPDDDAFSDPARMLANLRTFMRSLVVQPEAKCIAFGIMFRIAQWVDCIALVTSEIHPPRFDLALLGMADFPIGVSSFELGRVQLGLLARWNSEDHSFKILGALTDKSWLLHPKCKLHGGFAICLWFAGPYAGDFVVSIGGYSPLVPAKPHYPALDRVGFTWNAAEGLQLAGGVYLTLDRYGIQFGGRAALKYTSTILDVDASFSFDVLARWMPPFFQTKVRVSVHLEVRAIATIRFGLIVDANVYGPPFGAEFLLEIDLHVWQHTFTIHVGSTLDAANKAAVPNRQSVLAFAKGGKTTAMQIQVLGHSMTPRQTNGSTDVVSFGVAPDKPRKRLRADELKLALATSIPVRTVFRQNKSPDMRHPYEGDSLDIRLLGWRDVVSDLIWDIRGPTNPAEWICIPEMTRTLEALWYLPPNDNNAYSDSGRRAVTSIRFEAPIGRYGDAGMGALPPERLAESDADMIRQVQSLPGRTSGPTLLVKDSETKGGSSFETQDWLAKLNSLGFDLGGCQSTGVFRPLDAVSPRNTP